jgi:hypothetical protein
MIFGSLVLLACAIWAQNYEPVLSYGVRWSAVRLLGRNVRHGADPLPCSSPGDYMRVPDLHHAREVVSSSQHNKTPCMADTAT